VGTDESGDTLFLVVVDGRQERSVGTDLGVLADFMIELGAWNALNLDGGGSSALYVESKGGTVNRPCEGGERSVLNTLAVILSEKLQESPAADGPEAAGPKAAGPASTARAGLVRFGEGDFTPGKGLAHPPRLKLALRAAGVSALVALVLVSTVLIYRRRKRRAVACPRTGDRGGRPAVSS
jgi:hypothetical protein